MERPNFKDSKGMLIEGIFASSLIDSSSEIVDIKGMDISSMEEGKAPCNWEHASATDGLGKEICGRVVFVHKLYSESDCETDSERYFF
jgi:hypothetical protein